MCGIAGFITSTIADPKVALLKMAESLHHRGPDDKGIWFDKSSGVGFAHTRLSILDLSPSGHQPMVSASGRYVITYNGEVYNFSEIKKALSKSFSIPWRSHSDTEVILEAIDAWGVEKAISQFNGMFAFAVYDRQEKILVLARDRAGIKPLYYGFSGKHFLFASELKAIEALPFFKSNLNRKAMAQFFKFKYIPAPDSIYENIHKLEPGCLLTLPVAQFEDKSALTIKSYWSIKSVARAWQSVLLHTSEDVLLSQLETLLEDAVKRRQLSDVPLGTFLSGGIDSSIVTALAQKNSLNPLKTFTIGFSEAKYNEAEYAKAIAQYLGTDHHELYLSAAETRAVIPDMANLYDEPFADSSQIPTYILSRFSREKVTVCLSGDGGDELFAGYGRYHIAYKLWQLLSKIPYWLRNIFGSLLAAGLGSRSNVKLQKLAYAVRAKDLDSLYGYFLRVGLPKDHLVLNEKSAYLQETTHAAALQEGFSYVMLKDFSEYLPGDILTKVDRASMGVSLEARVPLLDYRVVEFAWQLPLAVKIKQGQSKYLLKKLLSKYLPEALFIRPKQGFSVPIAHWLNNELRDWAESLLSSHTIKSQGLLNDTLIQRRWKEHKLGRCNWEYWLWNVLIFQAWLGR